MTNYNKDPVGNQTFFSKSKILEKVVNQVQGDVRYDKNNNRNLTKARDFSFLGVPMALFLLTLTVLVYIFYVRSSSFCLFSMVGVKMH